MLKNPVFCISWLVADSIFRMNSYFRFRSSPLNGAIEIFSVSLSNYFIEAEQTLLRTKFCKQNQDTGISTKSKIS